MDLTALTAKADALQRETPLPTKPECIVPDGAGVPGMHRTLIQVAITFWRGKASGAYANMMAGKAHRLEVSRMCPLEHAGPAEQKLMYKALGKKTEDHAARPDGRLSFVMGIGAPQGVQDRRPWATAFRSVEQAIVWACAAVLRDKTAQYALVMVVDTTETKDVTPLNERFDPYSEAQITAVLALEVVKLDQGEGTIRAAAEAGEDDDIASLAE